MIDTFNLIVIVFMLTLALVDFILACHDKGITRTNVLYWTFVAILWLLISLGQSNKINQLEKQNTELVAIHSSCTNIVERK